MGLDQGIYKNGEEVLYLRKANQVHGYMNSVSNLLYGRDYENTEMMAIGLPTISQLHAIAVKLVTDRNEEDAEWMLPPTTGFFFGSYEIDDWYWTQLEDLAAGLGTLIKFHSPDDEYAYWAWW